MRIVCIDSLGEGRPHVMLMMCWCRPYVCTDGHVHHRDIDGRGYDARPRMAVYSEQYVRGMAPEDG